MAIAMPWHNAKPRHRSKKAQATFIDPRLPTQVPVPPIGKTWAIESELGVKSCHSDQ
jgi:hypothetical protein